MNPSRDVPAVLAAAVTNPGLKREHNEDAFLLDVTRGRFAVIDGMGGAKGGEVAAEMTRAALEQDTPLVAAIVEANRRVRDRGRTDYEVGGMGCVLTAVELVGGELRVAHVGDTRAILVARDGVRQLTTDHTMTAVRREFQGRDPHDDEDGVEPDHQVTRNVGGMEDGDGEWVDQTTVPFAPGDMLLLCSDGLHDVVRRRELAERLVVARARSQEPDALARELVALALERGGPDNVTVLVVRRPGAPQESTRAVVKSPPSQPEASPPSSEAEASPPPALLRWLGGSAILVLGVALGWGGAHLVAPPSDGPVEASACASLSGRVEVGVGRPAPGPVCLPPGATLAVAPGALPVTVVRGEGGVLSLGDWRLESQPDGAWRVTPPAAAPEAPPAPVPPLAPPPESTPAPSAAAATDSAASATSRPATSRPAKPAAALAAGSAGTATESPPGAPSAKPDSSSLPVVAPPPDAAPAPDVAPAPDAAPASDAAPAPDAAPASDAAPQPEAVPPSDSALPSEAAPAEGGVPKPVGKGRRGP